MRKTRSDPVGDLRAYPGNDARAAWAGAANALTWLVAEDRLSLEIVANATATIRKTAKAGEPIRAAQFTAARQALSSLGATPANRSKIHIPGDDDESDPFAQFGHMTDPDARLCHAVPAHTLHDAARDLGVDWLTSRDFRIVCDLARMDSEAVMTRFDPERLRALIKAA